MLMDNIEDQNVKIEKKMIFLAFLVMFAYLYHYERDGSDSYLLR